MNKVASTSTRAYKKTSMEEKSTLWLKVFSTQIVFIQWKNGVSLRNNNAFINCSWD